MHMITQKFHLTTAEIFYRMPDHKCILQSFVWQTIDTAPHYPRVRRFLAFWEANLDGPIHSVRVVGHDLSDSPSRCGAVTEFVLH